jgi:hypothetical protein
MYQVQVLRIMGKRSVLLFKSIQLSNSIFSTTVIEMWQSAHRLSKIYDPNLKALKGQKVGNTTSHW